MTDSTTTLVPPPPPPPPPSTRTQEGAATPTRLRHPLALFVAALMSGLGAAILVGLPSGVVVGGLAANDCSPSDGWCELGAVAAGFFVGVVIAGIAYVVAGVVTVSRCRAHSRRAGHIVAHLAAPPVLLVVTGVIANL